METSPPVDDEPIIPVIIDPGTYTTRGGLSTNELYTVCVPTEYSARHKLGRISQDPVDQLAARWDEDIHLFLSDIYGSELRIAAEEHPLILIDRIHAWSVTSVREKKAEILFDYVQVPWLYMPTEPAASLIASGCDSGLIVHIGTHFSRSFCIHNGRIIRNTMVQNENSSNECMHRVYKILEHSGKSDFTQADIKRLIKMCHVSATGRTEPAHKLAQLEFTLFNGSSVILSNTTLDAAPEVFFDQRILIDIDNEVDRGRPMSVHFEPISTMAACSLTRVDESLLPMMMKNIIVLGGTSDMSGFKARLQEELPKECANHPAASKALKEISQGEMSVRRPVGREDSAWIGGRMLASKTDLNWITRSEYEEEGPARMLEKKCPIWSV